MQLTAIWLQRQILSLSWSWTLWIFRYVFVTFCLRTWRVWMPDDLHGHEKFYKVFGRCVEVTLLHFCSLAFTGRLKRVRWGDDISCCELSGEENSAAEGKFITVSWKIWSWRYFPFPASSHDVHTALGLMCFWKPILKLTPVLCFFYRGMPKGHTWCQYETSNLGK